MYNEFFGFERAPFNNTPDPAFFYESKSHREAMATMVYGVEQGKGFVMVTGDVGMGKTMLSQALKQSLGDDYVVIEIANPWSSPEEVLSAIRLCVNVQGPENNALFDGLRDRLMNLRQQGKRVVIVIDEAHQMSERMIEGIRLLSNVETPTEKLLQIIFIGQNELAEMLSRHSMRQIQQRLFLSRHLEAFSDSETIAYIRHRLTVAGGKPETFDEAALRLIARESSGTPRVINQLCDNALLFAMGRNQHQVTQDDVKEALRLLRPWQAVRQTPPISSPPGRSTPPKETPEPSAAAPSRAKADPLPFKLPIGEQSTRGFDHSQQQKAPGLPFSLPIDNKAKDTGPVRSTEQSIPEYLLRTDKRRNFLIPAMAIIGVAALAGGVGWYSQQEKPEIKPSAPTSPPPVSHTQAPAMPAATFTNDRSEPITLSLATSLRITQTETEAPSAPPPSPVAVPASSNPSPTRAQALSLPQTSNTRIVTVPREGGVARIAAETFGLWNESARDLILAANPELNPALDQLAGGSFLKIPALSRESLIVEGGPGAVNIYYGSFSSAEEAQAELGGLRRIWPNSQIQQASRGNLTLHRVFIGSFASRSEAVTALDSLWFKHLPALN